MMHYSVEDWVRQLDLLPHPEGGYYKEIIKAERQAEGQTRPAYTSIYFLLTDDNISHFHRIDADEIWYYHYGHTLTVHMIHPDGQYEAVDIGPDVTKGEVLQHVVPAGTIFASSIKAEKGYALVGCMCQPGFMFDHFEMFDQAELNKAYPHLTEVITKYALKSID